jgi:transposase
MRRQGMAYRKIEELTGVSHNTVIYWHKEVTDSKAPNASCCCSEMVQKPQKTMIEYSKFHE